MKFWSDAIANGGEIPARLAFGRHDPKSHVVLSDNLSPHLAWSDVPAGTRSLAVIVHDRDVPSRGDDVNQEGKSVPHDLPRVDFFHWLLVDLPADGRPLGEGEFSRGVVAHGKPGPAAARGTRQGINDYESWFSGDPSMKGAYHGYDGPCPPWNDTRVHHYHFTLYALDVARCPVEGAFHGADLRKALEAHTLATASFVGTYAINPAAQK